MRVDSPPRPPRLILPSTPLQLLDRTFGILALFDAQAPTWSLSEVARAMNLKSTTTHRILQVLHQHGFLGRDETTKRYHLGMAALDLGVRARGALRGQEGTVSALRWLASATGESAYLLVPSADHLHSVCMQRAEAAAPLRLTINIGRRLPIHAGAGQKVLLAFLPSEERDRVLSRPLERIARKTVTDPAILRTELEEISRQGWTLSFEESHDGTWGIAVALLHPSGTVAASVGTAGPLFRFTKEGGESCRREVLRAARSIAEELGLRMVKPAKEGKRRQLGDAL